MLKKGAAAAVLALAFTASLHAQPEDRTAALARGWTAVAAGRYAQAEEAARRWLTAHPGDHDAASLRLSALAAQAKATGALDAYEQWLTASHDEDPFLLRTVGVAFLQDLSKATEPRVRYLALATLAAHGDHAARTALSGAESELPPDADAELAASGDANAAQRLVAAVQAGGPSDKTHAIDALGRSKAPAAAAALIAALKDPAPPSRIAAANALADLGAVEAIPALKENLRDSDPAARNMARLALARLGDPAGGDALRTLDNSPVADYQLLAADIEARQSPTGEWAGRVEALLRNTDPLIRLDAAALLLQHGRSTETARNALSADAANASHAVRERAAAILARSDIPGKAELLRNMLRDAAPDVRLAAARALVGERATPGTR